MRMTLWVPVVVLLGTHISGVEAQGTVGQPMNQAVACNASLPTRPDLSPLARKLVLSGEPKATLEMQANPAKPTAAEKSAISQWVTLRDGCFALGAEWMDSISAPHWLRSIVLQSKDSADANVSALYRGQLTFGEFNVKQMALAANIRKRLDDAREAARRENATSQQNASAPAAPAAPAEPAAPVTAKPSPAEDRNQCEMDAARTYPVVLQQRMTDPGFQAPSNQRTQTNCNTYGGQVNCTTQPMGGVSASVYNRPPTYVSEDVNLGRRQATFVSCMEAKGYRRN